MPVSSCPPTQRRGEKCFTGARMAGCWRAEEEQRVIGDGKSLSMLDGAACVLQGISNPAWKPSGKWQELSNLWLSLNNYKLSLVRACNSRDLFLRFRGVVKKKVFFNTCLRSIFNNCLRSIRTASSFKVRYLPYYISTSPISQLNKFGCRTAHLPNVC